MNNDEKMVAAAHAGATRFSLGCSTAAERTLAWCDQQEHPILRL